MSDMQFDLVIIGGGPAGYTGAIRAAQLGLKTAVIEKEKTLGGTCLNWGCIPSKALLDSSEFYSMATHGESSGFASHGLKFTKVELDLPAMMSRKTKIVKDLTGGIDFLFKKNKITRLLGTGKLTSSKTIEVTAIDGAKTQIEAKNIILATGSVPIELPFAKFDSKNIVTSTDALSFEQVPEHLVIVGGGVIGLEFGSVWVRLGAKVTVLEFSDGICAGMDQQSSKVLLKSLEKQGIVIQLSQKVTGIKPNSHSKANTDKVEVSFEDAKTGEKKSISGTKVLVAVGRKAYSEGLGLEALGIERDERGRVKVDAEFRTKHANIFAIGDLIQGPMLAHKAEEEGVAVAELIATGHGHVNYDTVPGVVYTWPEFASVGQTEEQLKQNNVVYKSGSFPFIANGRAKALGFTEGQVKILADAKTDRVLGVHIVGPRASDMIAEAVMAMEFGASSEDIARSFHGHPTLSEVMREAALAVDKRARQM
jgi:dihydrolipoamide dehydrogenase